LNFESHGLKNMIEMKDPQEMIKQILPKNLIFINKINEYFTPRGSITRDENFQEGFRISSTT